MVRAHARVLEQTENETGRWVTLGRACEILGVDESTIRRWADAGRLRVYRTPGGHRRFSLINLQEMVTGESRSRNDDIGRLAFAKIRRQLSKARHQEGGWYAQISEADRDLLRNLGRRLVDMVGEYIDKRTRRGGLLDEARQIGGEYGRVLLHAGLPLANAVEAYIGFRKTMDETTREASRREGLPTDEALETTGQVHVLGDQVLLGIAATYEEA